MNTVQNSVTLIGNLGKDPVITNNEKQSTITSFSLATNATYNNKKGERIVATEWHRCVAFGNKAEVLGQYARKGSKLAVQGQLRYNRYTDKAGVERLTVDIIVNDFIFLDKRQEKAA
ncbi:MAG: single-stranded DNA-binding protein [Bacteroidota bacterium]